MSQSTDGQGEPGFGEGPQRAERYGSGWGAMGWLLRQGMSWSGNERNVCFMGRGDGTFLEAGAALGLDSLEDGRSVARVDWDRDGDLDLIYRSRSAPRLRYLENRLPRRGEWVAAKLIHPKGAIGARLLVSADGVDVPWSQTLHAGEGYLSQSSEWLHIGVGNRSEVQLSVVWPGGTLEEFGPAQTSRSFVLVHGEGKPREVMPPQKLPVDPSAKPAESGMRGMPVGRHVLATPHPLPATRLQKTSGDPVTIGGIAAFQRGQTQRPMILLLWSPDCAPCLSELAEWSSAREQVSASGLGVLAVQVGSEGGSATQRPWLERVDWPFARALCPEDTGQLLHSISAYVTDSTGPMALPMAFLVDGKGQIQVIYWGRSTVQTVLADMSLFALQGPTRLRAALPFDGLYLDPPKKPDWRRWAQFFERRGLPDTAREVEWALVKTTHANGAEAQYQMGDARMRQGKPEEALPHLEQAATLAPQIARYLQRLANCLDALDRKTEALQYYETSLVADPRNEQVLYRVGMLRIEAGEIRAAERVLQTLRPLNAELSAQLAQRLEQSK